LLKSVHDSEPIIILASHAHKTGIQVQIFTTMERHGQFFDS